VGQYGRLILLILVIALTAWRLIRYMKAGLARRPQPGVPGVGGTVMGVPTPAPNSTSPTGEHVRGSVWTGLIAKTTTVLVFVGGNVLLWGSLFGLAALDEVPTIWRLLVGVFANFPLIRLAQATGTSVAKRLKPASRTDTNNTLL
jgi:hypothetical protein